MNMLGRSSRDRANVVSSSPVGQSPLSAATNSQELLLAMEENNRGMIGFRGRRTETPSPDGLQVHDASLFRAVHVPLFYLVDIILQWRFWFFFCFIFYQFFKFHFCAYSTFLFYLYVRTLDLIAQLRCKFPVTYLSRDPAQQAIWGLNIIKCCRIDRKGISTQTSGSNGKNSPTAISPQRDTVATSLPTVPSPVPRIPMSSIGLLSSPGPPLHLDPTVVETDEDIDLLVPDHSSTHAAWEYSNNTTQDLTFSINNWTFFDSAK